MWPLVIVYAALLLYTFLDDILSLFKSKDPHYQKEQERQQLEQKNEQSEIIQQLHALIGQECQLESRQFSLLSKPNKLTAKILNVEDDWIEFSYTKKSKTSTILFQTKEIQSVSKIIDS